MSLMELGRRIHLGQITLEDALREMKEGSSSVLLNWSWDDGGDNVGVLLDCGSGNRYIGTPASPAHTALF